jgi:hypothetical protein
MKAAHNFQVKMNSILDVSSMYVQGGYKTEIENTNQTEKEAEPETSNMKLALLIYGMNQLFSEVTKLTLPGLIAIGKY